ncbi:MAG: hypothetical protein C0432_01025 [Candidatus Puniceispirillum sp.]|nr:hypothetical protein [Candidatus Pelagibacter sp.]MBA4282865.1 hypothetical protein [Candidatus Puniceispirillum sp.]
MYKANIKKRLFFIIFMFPYFVNQNIQAQEVSLSSNTQPHTISNPTNTQPIPSKEEIIESIKHNLSSLKSYVTSPQDTQNNYQQIQATINNLDSNFQKVFSYINSESKSPNNNPSVLMPRERKTKSYRNNLKNLPIAQPNAT